MMIMRTSHFLRIAYLGILKAMQPKNQHQWKVKTENQSQKTLHQKMVILKKGTIQVQDINIGIRVAKTKRGKGLQLQVHHTIRLKMRKSRVTRHLTIEISKSTPI